MVTSSRSRRPAAPIALALVGLLASACGAPEATQDDDSEATGADDDSMLPPMDFLGELCDPYGDDCDEGLKCGPIAVEPYAHIFTEHRCVPVSTDTVGLDDICISWGLRPENYDTCEPGLVCWGAKDYEVPPTDDDDGGQAAKLPMGGLSSVPMPTNPLHGDEYGLCRELCTGTADDPDCGGKWGWCVKNNGTDICVHTCNPLDSNCDGAHNCLWDEGRETLNCLHVPPVDFGLGEVCTGFGAACERGLNCDPAEQVPGCPEGEYCCNSWCATDGSVACAFEEQTCERFWPEDDTPPGQELVGRCVLPTP